MNIIQEPSFNDNYIYILDDAQSSGLTVVDPGDPEVILSYARQHSKSLEHVLITHHHWDHTDGLPALREAYPACEVWAPSLAQARYPHATQQASVGKTIHVGGYAWEVLDLAGHTYDHIGYWHAPSRTLFSGDTLFNMGCGRIFDGSLDRLYESLQQIKVLPSDTQVYCTHEYTMANIQFAKSLETPPALITFERAMQALRDAQEPTVPFELGPNIQLNPFLTAPDFDTFCQRRKAKDQF